MCPSAFFAVVASIESDHRDLCTRPQGCARFPTLRSRCYDDLNESVFAERVAKSLGIKLLSCRANGEVFRGTLVPRDLSQRDQPMTHPVSVFFRKVSELAHITV